MKSVIHKNFHLKYPIGLFLIFITLCAFWNVRYNDFINLDDNPYILDNPHVKKGLSISGIQWAFTKVHAGHWHPITWLSHMMDVELFGLDSGKHHLVNLVIHILNVLFLFTLLNKLTGLTWESGFVSAFFAVHPLRVESVAWAAERKDVLCALFFFLTIYIYLRFLEKKTIFCYLLILLSFSFALMSKPMAVTLPFVLLLLDFWPLGRFSRISFNTILPLLREKIPLFLLTTFISFLTYINHLQSGGVTSFEKLPLVIRIQNALVSYLLYLYKMLWPESLAVLYPHPVHLPMWKVLGSALFLILVTSAVIFLKKSNPSLAVGWFWYLGTLVPVIGIIQAGPQSMADRFSYIPHIGAYIMILFGTSKILNGRTKIKKVAILLGIISLFSLAWVTSKQVSRWRDSVTLFTHTLNITDKNYLIHNKLGATLMREGKYQEAENHFKKAILFKPNYWDAYVNLGTVLFLQGNREGALRLLSQVLKLNPKHPEIHNALGEILVNIGKWDEAISHFSIAIETRDDYAEAHYNLGTIYLRLEKVPEAIDHLTRSAQIAPDIAKTHHNLGLAFQTTGLQEEAVKHFKIALSLRPDNADTHFCLAILLLRQGKKEEALFHLNETIKLNPNDTEAISHLRDLDKRLRN